MPEPVFGTAINCIDGRVQIPVLKWMHQHAGVEFTDLVTEPGPDRVLSSYQITQLLSIKERVGVSVRAHHSQLIAVVGHHDCAANPVSEEEHRKQIELAVKMVKTWSTGAKLIGLWVNEKWEVEVVVEAG